jgi:hypothetical protein
VITAAMGFEPRRKYELVVTPGWGEPPDAARARKADVYARGVVTLR